MAVNDEVTVRVVGRYQAQNIVNTLHYEIIEQAAEEKDILSELLTVWATTLKVQWLARHLDTYQLVGLKAFNKEGAAKTPAFSSLGDSGTVVGDEVASVVCRTITLYTASDNHRHRGRIMLSGSGTGMFDDADGSVSTVEIAALTALGGAFESGLSAVGNSFRFVLGSTLTHGVFPIVDSAGRETPSVLRSRRIKQFLIG